MLSIDKFLKTSTSKHWLMMMIMIKKRRLCNQDIRRLIPNCSLHPPSVKSSIQEFFCRRRVLFVFLIPPHPSHARLRLLRLIFFSSVSSPFPSSPLLLLRLLFFSSVSSSSPPSLLLQILPFLQIHLL